MNTVQVELFNINELSDKAKENAHTNFLQCAYDYQWMDEGLDSIKAFCELFNTKLKNYSISPHNHSFICAELTQDNIRGIKRIDIPQVGTCALTGYCLDEDILEDYHKVLTNSGGNIRYAFNSAIQEGMYSIIRDMEYQETMEYFIETAEVNEYEFTKDGNTPNF